MLTIHSETDIRICQEIWDRLVKPQQLTDLWEVRVCFHENFTRDLFFVVAKENDQIVGFIPLCYIPECDYYGFFPGEIWQEKTWLEQNRLIARDQTVLRQMFEWLKENHIRYYLRYLCEHPAFLEDLAHEDEIGYLFLPKFYDYSIEQYHSVFSRKSIKNILREVGKMHERNLIIRENCSDDFEQMVSLNIDRFGTQSYFANNQFVNSFRAMKDLLDRKGWLRMTALLIDSRIAAVDMGCVYNGQYTLLAGGTHEDFPGIAKAINLHHMQEACKNKYESVDFLCGDFSWKKIFHLTPRPLYKATNIKLSGVEHV